MAPGSRWAGRTVRGHGKTVDVAALDDLDELRRVLDAARDELPGTVDTAAEVLGRAVSRGGRVLVCGNGGSAAAAQHFVAELVGRLRTQRAPMAAVALSADTVTLTALANDSGFDQVFARQVEALGRPGDVLVALSTSGRSPNVLAAARAARSMGMTVIALTGAGGGDLGALTDVVVAVPSNTVARVQEVHALCLHALARALEDALLGTP